MQSFPADLRIINPVRAVSGSPGNDVVSIDVRKAANGSLVLVQGGQLYKLDKASTLAVQNPVILPTNLGAAVAGRWIAITSGTNPGGVIEVDLVGSDSTPLVATAGSVVINFDLSTVNGVALARPGTQLFASYMLMANTDLNDAYYSWRGRSLGINTAAATYLAATPTPGYTQGAVMTASEAITGNIVAGQTLTVTGAVTGWSGTTVYGFCRLKLQLVDVDATFPTP